MTITLANPPSSPRAAVWRVPNIRPATRRGGHARKQLSSDLALAPQVRDLGCGGGGFYERTMN
jgi:hypothetical protein